MQHRKMKVSIDMVKLNQKTAKVINEIFKVSLKVEENSGNSIEAQIRDKIIKKYGQDCYANIYKKTKNLVEEYLINKYFYSHKFEPYLAKIKKEIEGIIKENK